MHVAFTTNLSDVLLFLPIFCLKGGTTIGGGGRSLAVLTLKSKSQPV
jgi:hypothetical protein